MPGNGAQKTTGGSHCGTSIIYLRCDFYYLNICYKIIKYLLSLRFKSAFLWYKALMGLPFGVIKWLNAVFSLWGLAALLEEVFQGSGTKVNDSDTSCAATMVVEGSRLWNRGSQESAVWLTLCWRNEAPWETWGLSRADVKLWWEGWRASAPQQLYLSSDLSCGLHVSPNDVTVLFSEGLSGFLFSKSSDQREMSIVSGYYWNTFPASQSLLYLSKWKLLLVY